MYFQVASPHFSCHLSFPPNSFLDIFRSPQLLCETVKVCVCLSACCSNGSTQNMSTERTGGLSCVLPAELQKQNSNSWGLVSRILLLFVLCSHLSKPLPCSLQACLPQTVFCALKYTAKSSLLSSFLSELIVTANPDSQLLLKILKTMSPLWPNSNDRELRDSICFGWGGMCSSTGLSQPNLLHFSLPLPVDSVPVLSTPHHETFPALCTKSVQLNYSLTSLANPLN